MVTVQQVGSQLLPPRPAKLELFDGKGIEGHLGQQPCPSQMQKLQHRGMLEESRKFVTCADS